jgi:hypothetical protein
MDNMAKNMFSLNLNSLSIGNEDHSEYFVKFLKRSQKRVISRLWTILGLIVIYWLIGFLVNIPTLSYLILIITGSIGIILMPMIFIYIYFTIHARNQKINHGFINFSRNCTQLSMKNYRLLKEYRDIYHFHHEDMRTQCTEKYLDGQLNVCKNDDDLTVYVNYVLQNDHHNKMESHQWIESIIGRVYHYIQLCYYLSFIGPCDELELKQNTIYLNINTDSIMNKRNRKLEKVINQIPMEYKYELMDAWTNTDHNDSDRLLTMIPCKWIMYEYRNMFRYLMCAKYFKHIFSAFDNDNAEIEQIVFNISDSVKEMFKIYQNIQVLPRPFVNLFNILINTFLITLDNYIAISFIISFQESHILSMIIYPIIYVVVFSIINGLISTIDQIGTETNDALESMDKTEFETIFNEMKTITFDGKQHKSS